MDQCMRCLVVMSALALSSCAMGGPIRGSVGEDPDARPAEGARAMEIAPPPPPPSMAEEPTAPPPPPEAESSSGEEEPSEVNPACRIDISDGVPPLPDACLPRCAPMTMERG